MSQSQSQSDSLLRVESLRKSYGNGPIVLDDVNLSFRKGEFVVILGLSGAGKSTFLRCVNRLVEPSGGRILVPQQLIKHDGETQLVDVARMSARDLRLWRRKVGMIFQQFNVVKRLSVLQNVLSGSLGYQPVFSTMLRRYSKADRERALRNLERVGLLELAYQRADKLSGGQQQRVAIARALMQEPAVILADEPVASLDPRLSVIILDILRRIAREDGITVVVSLHVLEQARRYADRLIGFHGGQVVFDGAPGDLTEQVVERIYQLDYTDVGLVV